MPRRTELKGLCNNLLAAFTSRNNDLDGYWALGFCSLWLEDKGENLLALPLIGCSMANLEPKQAALSLQFALRLITFANRQKLPLSWITQGLMSVERLSDAQLRCSVQLVSDLGQTFKTETVVSARRHNPRLELRRGR